jgi:hypothetical protein
MNTTNEHLTRLFNRVPEEYPGGLIELHRFDTDREVWHNAYFQATDIDKAAQWAEDYNKAGNNVYVGVNPRKPETFPGGFATNDDIEVSFFHFADLDSQEAVDIARADTQSQYTMHVVTGTTPHKRVHLYWELENPSGNLKAWSDTQAGIADYYHGDRVIDPRRIMRLAGLKNYPSPKKKERGYVTETVTLKTEFEDDRDPVTALSMHHRFVASKPKEKVNVENGESLPFTPQSSGSLNLPGASGTNVNDLVKQINEGREWHNNMIRLVAHWIDRGWSDTEIMLACRPFTQEGYTHNDTDNEVRKAIKGGRAKWGVTNPEYDVEEALHEVREDLDAQQITDADKKALKPREWITRGRYIRRRVTLTIAPPGVGKTTLVMQEALAIAAGITYAEMETEIQGKVWIYNNEDDRQELLLRIIAAAQAMGIDWDKVKANVYVNSGDDRPLMVAKEDPKTGEVLILPDVQACVEIIKANNIIMFAVDPLVETHMVSENSNEGMSQVARAFRKIAQDCNAAVSLVHHSRKVSSGDQTSHVGNADTSRGAGSVVGVARIAHTLYQMTKRDAEHYGVEPNERHRYVRMDDAKANLSLATNKAKWFYRHSENIIVGKLGYQEEVGVLIHHDLKPVEDGQPDFKHVAENLIKEYKTIKGAEISQLLIGELGMKKTAVYDALQLHIRVNGNGEYQTRRWGKNDKIKWYKDGKEYVYAFEEFT